MENHDNVGDEIPLIIFDSSCLLCTRTINTILENERSKEFRFTPLNSDFAKSLNLKSEYVDPIPDSIILYHHKKIFLESTAVLKVSKLLKPPFSYMQIFLIIPGFLRNAIYKFIAKNRYNWFGTHVDNCYWVPPSERYRFIK